MLGRFQAVRDSQRISVPLHRGLEVLGGVGSRALDADFSGATGVGGGAHHHVWPGRVVRASVRSREPHVAGGLGEFGRARVRKCDYRGKRSRAAFSSLAASTGFRTPVSEIAGDV